MSEELKLAKTLALKAGGVMLKYFEKGMKQKYKSDNSIVTNADEEINKLVIDAINKKYPDHAVFGEEQSTKNKSDLVWLCDPIDGTWPYSRGVALSAFSLALVDKGKSVLGVMYDPFLKKLYSSTKGKGAYLNNKKIKVSSRSVEKSSINSEWWPEAPYNIGTAMHQLSVDTSAYIFTLGSAVYGSCLVAEGVYEATIFAGTKGKSVDIAAAKVIVEEAGGKVTDLYGKEQKYFQDVKGAIISNGVVHEDILNYTKKL